jgi:hypothetical protein
LNVNSVNHLARESVKTTARSETLACYQQRILAAVAVVLDENQRYHEDRDLVVRPTARCSTRSRRAIRIRSA